MFPPFIFRKDSIKGANGVNWPFVVLIEKGIPAYAAILAQEVVESRRSALFGTIASIVLSLAAYLYGLPSLWLLVFPAMLGFLVNALPVLQRDAEALGQTVETVVRAQFYGQDFNTALLANAMQLHGGSSYDQFDGRSVEEIAEYMRRRIPAAERWVNKHRTWIASQA